MAGRVPVILQAEASECGLAAVAMVAAAHGRSVELAELRRRLTPADRAPTLTGLTAVAGLLGLAARPVRARLAELRSLELPAILHWQFDHFVVVTRVARRAVTIHDPACGQRRISIDEASRSFTGVAIECRPCGRPAIQSVATRPTLATLMRAFPGLHRYLVLMLGLMLATQVFALAPPVATQLLIDEIVLARNQAWRHSVLLAVGLMLMASVGLDAMRRWFALYTGTKLAEDGTAAVVRHLFLLAPETVLRRHVGDLVSRIESLRPIRTALTETCITGVAQLIVLSSTLLVMALYSVSLTLISLGMLAVAIGIQATLLPRTRSLSLEALVAMAKASNSLIDSLRAFETVRTLGLDRQRHDVWRAQFATGTNASARAARLGILAGAGQGLASAADQLLFLGIGISQVGDRQLSIGALFAFLALRGRLGAAVISLTGVARELYLLRPHVERVSEILVERPESAPTPAVCKPIVGRIRCENLGYQYPGSAALLDAFDADIASGEFVVVTGASGCGKSTLLRLIAGSLRPEAGRILVDDLDLRLWQPRTLRQQLGVVMQNDRLLAGSLADNISCFDPAPNIDRIREVALIAEVWQDIEALPMGLYTPITGATGGLSGGQVQRIFIARALYRRPRVLLLDEATNQLDAGSEKRVLANLRGQGITIVAVAHGEQVVARAGRVIRLDKSRAGPSGTVTIRAPGGIAHGNSTVGLS